jgi:hypothetical protein
MESEEQRENSNSRKGLLILGLVIITSIMGATLYSWNHRHPTDKVEYWWDIQSPESGDPRYFNDEWSSLLLLTKIPWAEFRETPSEAGVQFILEKAIENGAADFGSPKTELTVEFPGRKSGDATDITLNLQDIYCWDALRRIAIELNCRVQIEEKSRLVFRPINDPSIEKVVAKFDGLPHVLKDGKLVFSLRHESGTPADLSEKFRIEGVALADGDSIIYYPDRDVFIASTALDQMPAISHLNQKLLCGISIAGPRNWWEACRWKMDEWMNNSKKLFISEPSTHAPILPTGSTVEPDPFQ